MPLTEIPPLTASDIAKFPHSPQDCVELATPPPGYSWHGINAEKAFPASDRYHIKLEGEQEAIFQYYLREVSIEPYMLSDWLWRPSQGFYEGLECPMEWPEIYFPTRGNWTQYEGSIPPPTAPLWYEPSQTLFEWMAIPGGGVVEIGNPYFPESEQPWFLHHPTGTGDPYPCDARWWYHTSWVVELWCQVPFNRLTPIVAALLLAGVLGVSTGVFTRRENA